MKTIPQSPQYQEFVAESKENIEGMASDEKVQRATRQWLDTTYRHKYSFNFEALGRPIIQYPQDIVAMQELIWSLRPDLIIETGIAHGGSLMLSASMLALLDYCEAVEAGAPFDPRATQRRVLGIDIDIREHNRKAIEAHPLAHRIDMMQGSSIDPGIIQQVHKHAQGYARILVCLDSNHTHDHVLAELEAYAPLTSPGSYCVAFDTIVEDLPADTFPDRPWGRGNNPKTAVREYLRRLRDEGRTAADGAPLRLEVDRAIEDKLQITVAPEGYLRRVA